MQKSRDVWVHLPANEIKEKMVNIIESPCGTGKTTAIAAFLKSLLEQSAHMNDRLLVMTFRQTLALKLSKDLECVNYMEDRNSSTIDFTETRRLVISPESLHRLGQLNAISNSQEFILPSILVIDEYMSFIEHMFNDATLTSIKRSLFFHIFASVLANKDTTVILADAYFQKSSRDTLFRIAPLIKMPLSRLRHIKNRFKGEARTIYYTHSYKMWKELLDLATTSKKEKLYVFSNWKSILDGLQVEYGSIFGREEQGFPRKVFSGCYYISSDSSPEQKEECSQSCDDIIDDFEHLYASPTISAGISVDSQKFDTAFGYAGCHSTSPLGTLQLSKRVRTLKSNEVYLYCYKSIKTPSMKELAKSSNGGRNAPNKQLIYTYDDVYNALQMGSSQIRKAYKDCRNLGFTQEEGTNKLVRKLDTKDLVNQFLIEVVKMELDSKADYIGTLKRLAQVDNYEFINLDRKSGKRKREQFYENNPETTALLANPQHSISKTLSSAKEFRYGCITNWDGVFKDPTGKSSPMLSALRKFIGEWNALGAYGHFTEMINEHKDPNIQKQVTFNPMNCAKFYNDYVVGDYQNEFHKFISNHISIGATKDFLEYSIGGFSSSSQQYLLIAELVELYAIAPVVKYHGKNWFGNMQETDFSGHAWKDVIPERDCRKPLVEQEVNDHLSYLLNVFNNMYTSYDELSINNPQSMIQARAILKKFWAIITTSGLLTPSMLSKCGIKGLGVGGLEFLCSTSEINADDANKIQLICNTLIRAGLRKVGLGVTVAKKGNRQRSVCGNYTVGITANVSRKYKSFKIEKFKERLMLSVLKYLKQKSLYPFRYVIGETSLYRASVEGIPNYPTPDPFELLLYDPMQWMCSPHLNRFRVEHREKWKPLPEYWSDISKPDSKINREEYGYDPVSNPILPMSEHAPARLDNIVLYALVWRYCNSSDSERLFTKKGTIYSPSVCNTPRTSIGYLNYVYQPDNTRIEIAHGDHTSESFDALSTEEACKCIEELKKKYPQFQE